MIQITCDRCKSAGPLEKSIGVPRHWGKGQIDFHAGMKAGETYGNGLRFRRTVWLCPACLKKIEGGLDRKEPSLRGELADAVYEAIMKIVEERSE